MRRLSTVLVCALVVLAGCAGGGGGSDAAASETAAPNGGQTGDAEAGGGDGNGDGDGGSGDGDASESADVDETAMIPALRAGESFAYEVRSGVLAGEPETGTLTVDVTRSGEWPDVEMDVVRDAPSGRLEATAERAAYSPALGEMSYALNVRSIVVTSRLVTGRSTDVRAYEVGQRWRFDSADSDLGFEVVAEEEVAGLTAKRVRITGGEGTDTDAEIWLAPDLGLPVKFVQTEDGEESIALTLTAYESP